MAKFMGIYSVATVDGRGEYHTVGRFDGPGEACDYCEFYAGKASRLNDQLTELGCGTEGLIREVIMHRTRGKRRVALQKWTTRQFATGAQVAS